MYTYTDGVGCVVVHRDDVNLYRAELAKWAFDQLRGEIASSSSPESLLLGMINLGNIHSDMSRKALYSQSSRYVASFVKGRGEEKGGTGTMEVDSDSQGGDEGAGEGAGEGASEGASEVKGGDRTHLDFDGNPKVKQPE